MFGPRLIALILFALGATPALAYVRTMSIAGRPLFWSNPAVTMKSNPINSSGLTTLQVSTELSAAFAGWQAPGSHVGFSYTQSSGFPTNSNNDGINAIYFSSASNRQMEYGVVALTEVMYYVASSQIVEADMVFNDDQFLFTDTEGDTGRTINGRTAIYLRDVATHEAGHVLGLDHSLVNWSSLIYTAFNGQFTPSYDDLNGASTVYPDSPAADSSLTGTVSGTAGGIFGAHVTAINLETGKIEAGTLTGTDGAFRLGDIPAGKYAVMMEPFGTSISSVSSYYENVNHRFCGSSRFRRRFYSACNSQGLASVLNLGAQSNLSLGTLAPSCSQMGNPGGPPNSIAHARELNASGGAGWGTMRPGETHYYIVRGVSGQLSARAMSYSLYSPIDVKVEILQANGTVLAGATTLDNVQNPGPGGVTNFDSEASANVASGDYLLRITAAGARIPASKYSAGYELLDADGHYLVALGVNGNYGATALTDMEACTTVRNSIQNASYKDYKENNTQERTAGCASLGQSGGPFSGGMMQVLLTALAIHFLILAHRFRHRVGLVRQRR